ncbi:MAG: hypothetical protein HY000_24890 [Planctomycetes bacterium]|nr:hypothetical protein [Planctomycetota bacterium]
MIRITLGRATEEKLSEVKYRAELCDQSGNVMGYFIRRRSPRVYEEGEVPFTEEELDRIERQPGGRTLAEILADLEGRE